MGVTIAVTLMLLALLLVARTDMDVNPACQEDEAWVPTHYSNPLGVEDSNGVTRWCEHLDDI